MLRLSEVTVTRGGRTIVDRLDLAVPAGRVFWVVGPNGAGKSALLRVLAGLEQPATGRVSPPPGTWVRYVHSEMGLPATATVGDWERLVRQLLPASHDRGRTALWPDVPASRRLGRLSTGERKRLLLDPVMRTAGPLLLDEPFAHLSPEAKSELLRLVRERAAHAVVVVATNQETGLAEREGALPLGAEPFEPHRGVVS